MCGTPWGPSALMLAPMICLHFFSVTLQFTTRALLLIVVAHYITVIATVAAGCLRAWGASAP